MTLKIQRLAAFPFEGQGGNPAGVVLNASGLTDSEMQATAARVGYSETVFVTHQSGSRLRVRYFSPEMEVDFCGHATISAGVALGESTGAGDFIFETNTGDVDVRVTATEDGIAAELTSHIGYTAAMNQLHMSQLLEILSWQATDLASDFEPLIANAGNSHPVLVLQSVKTLENLEYNFEALKKLCRENAWPTIQLVALESPKVWRSRNPFAFGGVYEDPATGSAALAFGAYLRETGAAKPGESFTIKQGFEMGQPCQLNVTIEKDHCTVSGRAIGIVVEN